MDISSWVAHWARWCPDRRAITYEDRDLTWSQLERDVAKMAGALRDSGVAQGDRVAYLGPNTPQLLELVFAVARIGAILVPLNVRMPAAELRVFTEDCEPQLLIAESSTGEVARAVADGSATGLVVFDASDALYPRISTSDSLLPPGGEVTLTEPLLIMYTSGTTGHPKGAVLTQEALFYNAINARGAFDLSQHDIVLTNGPMFHVGGMNILTTPAVAAGATIVIQRAFDPDSMLEAIERRSVSLAIAVPVMTHALTTSSCWSSTDLSSLRAVVTGSTGIEERAVAPWFARGIPALQVYGLTETTPTATVVPYADADRLALTAGKPVLSCAVRVIRKDGTEASAGEHGEIEIAGPTVMREYWRNPTATREALVDGWFRTGDAGYIDDEGVLHVIERIKEIIIVGGSNVYPQDVEAVLLESAEISEAAVVARTDGTLGEVPVAFVVLRPGTTITAREVLTLFDGKLAAYKHPRDVVFVDALPRTAFGKVRKAELRKMLADTPAVPSTRR